jgi:G protein-coupled receptor GPR1
MLLIQSDMTKALWLTIFPIYEMIHGPVKSSSAFCQTSGFFLTLGIEASDVAVLLIALHTGLYIFRGGSGLYPYRRYAYAGFLITPLFLTLLAFINKPAFVNSGEFCYLPTRPGWSRRALSWAPRYAIFASILVAYGYIYIYVTGLMNKFGAVSKTGGANFVPVGRRKLRKRTGSVPSTPPIAYHGLLPSTPSSEASALVLLGRQDSVSTIGSAYAPERRWLHGTLWEDRDAEDISEHGVTWKMPNFSHPRASAFHAETIDTPLDPLSQPTNTNDAEMVKLPPLTLIREAEPSPASSLSAATTAHIPRPERSFWHRSFAQSSRQSRSSSLPNIFAMLRHGPRSSVSSSSTILPPPLLDSMGMVETRAKIRRQLRQLFIYPLVYLAVWLVPFVSHIKGEDHNGSPTVLAMISLLSLCAQGAANALIFSVKEKPWRHAKRRPRGYHHGLWSRYNQQEGVNPNVGRTREEMLVDGRIARRRRDEELAERRMQSFSRPNTARDWWEHLQDSVDDMEDLNELMERAT